MFDRELIGGCLWSQNNAVYICKRIEALQKKIKFCKRKWKYWENINVLFCKQKKKYCEKKISFANKKKELQKKKNKYCKKKISFANFYFAFQSSLSLRYRFPLCASRFCASHFVALFWHGGGVKGRGRVQQAWACLPGSDVIGPRHRSQLIQAPSLSRGMRVDRFLLFTSFKTCMFSFY